MKKLLAGLFLMALSMGCGGSQPAVRSPSPTISHMGQSTVALVVTDEEGDTYSYCTGVWVSQTEILTANHCVEAGARMALTFGMTVEEKEFFQDKPVNPVGFVIKFNTDAESVLGEEPKETHRGTVTRVDRDNDLGLIKVSSDNVPVHQVAELATQMPGIGERILCVGHPRGLYWTYVEGVVSSYRGNMPDGDGDVKHGPFLQVSAPIYFGNSGGGVFDTEGKLLGIASFIARAPNVAFYVHRDTINKFLYKK